jgi:hypothetical protein
MSLVQRYTLGAAIALLVSVSTSLYCAAPALAQEPSPQLAALSAVAPIVDCAKLSAADISAAVGAKTHITSAQPMPDAKPAPYCRVTGYVEPMVKFEVRLPLTTWTQRFVQTGCGGLCGNLNIRLGNDDGCYPAQHGELALASTDMGHSGGMDGQFGEKDYQLRIDFAYRGVHITTLAAKALIAAFYGQAPRYSYFSGCSDGGREALMEAQRYPQDFDGITAGAPAMNFTTQNTFYHGWNALKNTGADGKPVLTVDRLPILHQAVLQACDAADGVKDGLVSEPLSCHFDPGVVECKAGQSTQTCLTHAEVETARAIYQGAHDSKGNKFVLSGPLLGSELAWAGVYVPNAGSDRTMSATISTGTLKYLAYDKNPPDGYTLNDLQFTPESFTATTQLHDVYDSTDPDLTPFAKAGGKLILWHGLADPHISPLNTIAYYTAMNQVMGEKAVTQFTRLYLFPGGYHCGGGEGPFNFDLMSAIMAWVEKGSAPLALLASHQVLGPRGPIVGVPNGMPPGGTPPQGGPGKGPPPAGAPPAQQGDQNGAANGPAPKVDRTRPVYPYPLTAKYNRTGSVDEASNFTAGPAKPVSASQLQWMGSGFYKPHFEVWCQGQGAALTCNSKP